MDIGQAKESVTAAGRLPLAPKPSEHVLSIVWRRPFAAVKCHLKTPDTGSRIKYRSRQSSQYGQRLYCVRSMAHKPLSQ